VPGLRASRAHGGHAHAARARPPRQPQGPVRRRVPGAAHATAARADQAGPPGRRRLRVAPGRASWLSIRAVVCARRWRGCAARAPPPRFVCVPEKLNCKRPDSCGICCPTSDYPITFVVQQVITRWRSLIYFHQK
jgi:hypothetical protein